MCTSLLSAHIHQNCIIYLETFRCLKPGKSERLLHLSAVGGHVSFLFQCYPWPSYLLANLICMLLLIGNVTLRKICINPCQSSVPKSRNCHYTCQNSSLRIRPTISSTSLSDTHDKASIQYQLLVSLSFFWRHHDIARHMNRIFYYKE